MDINEKRFQGLLNHFFLLAPIIIPIKTKIIYFQDYVRKLEIQIEIIHKAKEDI